MGTRREARSTTRWAAARTSACLAAAAMLLCAGAVAAPISRTLRADGNLSDWTEILTSPENLSRDGDGSTLGCASSSDRDCVISAGDLDLLRFAWTWDDTDFYFYLQRASAGTRDAWAYLYLDVDLDGRVGTSDFVVPLLMPAASDVGDIEVFRYNPFAPGGDPLEDAGGFADGHDMPGSLGIAVNGNAGTFVSPDDGGAAWEARLKWTRLGLPAGSPLRFHVSIGTGSSLPGAGVEDNLGGSDGRAGTTGFRMTDTYPDRTTSTAPGRTVQLPHWIDNVGNIRDVVSLRARSATGQDLVLWLDADQDAVPDTLLARDAGGDGILTLPGDYLAPAGDSDADGVVDVGLLDMDEGALLYLEEGFDAGSGGLVEQIDLEAWIGSPGPSSSSARDLVRVGTITIVQDQSVTAVSGDVAWCPHVVQNNTFAPAVVDLSYVSVSGWTWDFRLDPNADGDPADATPVGDSDASGLPDVLLQPGQQAALFARADVPPAEPLGSIETVFVRAHLDGIPESSVVDGVVVMPPLDLAPSYVQVDGQARHGGGGDRIYFAHRLANHRGVDETITLSSTSDAGWPVTLLDDPDGDGRPYDSQPLASLDVTLGPNGRELAFILAVDVPLAARVGDVSHVTLTATGAAGASASVQDDAVAALVRIYAEAAHVLNVARVAECGEAFARSTGLLPSSSGYRFTWLDPSGTPLRTQDVATDAAGACENSLVLVAGQLGPGWRLEIQLWDGLAWTTLDTATFEIGDGWRMSDPDAIGAPYDLRAPRMTATATLSNDSFDGPLSDTVRWVVLTPDRLAYLDGTGSFLPYTGIESTSRDAVMLTAREQIVTMAVANVQFPGLGTYALEAWRSSGCSGDRLSATGTFEVIDDEDGDGVALDVETLAGTDPGDDDSDDDGLTDGLDGLGDSDGDGALDALDCDSDDDGLFDGLESGAWEPADGTANGSTCFVADAWPASTTDPDRADTDGGGVPDGMEDRDGDGRVASGERDPIDAADDFVGCSPTSPPAILDLRVRKTGGGVRLTWTPLADACVTYVVQSTSTLPAFTDLATGLLAPNLDDATSLGPPSLISYTVRASSLLSGPGQ